MMKSTDEAALEQGEIAFYRISADITARIFAAGMVNRLMRCEVLTDTAVHTQIVGHQISIFGDVAMQDRFQSFTVNRSHMEAAHVPITLYQGDDLLFVRTRYFTASFFNGLSLLAARAGAPVGFVGFNNAAARTQGVEIMSGDILFFRTGWRTKFVTERDPVAFMSGEPGLGLACCQWIHDHEIAAIGSDNWAIEVLPGENPDEPMQVHMVLIRDMGVTLGEILDLDELAADCAADGVWEFLLTAPPIKFTAAVGSPINPLAIK